ncbi:MAG: hypothetical protein BWY53_00653 [Parcubacteria group bacterium ADurb.Bin326]|nr:MAG: hypothetical protein BWY53_00653 [Parcubacteria group bacterium ADurb.Bin326]
MDAIEDRISKIEQRNIRVEADKAWETSWTRRFFIALFTYLVISLYMSVIGVEGPWLNAIIPTVGFLLSTLTLSFIKKIWVGKFKK